MRGARSQRADVATSIVAEMRGLAVTLYRTAAAFACVLLGALVAFSPVVAIVAGLAVVLAATLLLSDPARLPAMAFAFFIFLPLDHVPGITWTLARFLVPSAAVLAWWYLREYGTARLHDIADILALALVVYLVAGSLMGQAPLLSLRWAVPFTILVAAPVLVRGSAAPRAAPLLQSVWAGSAALLGLLAVAEAALGTNPLHAYELAETSREVWSVYRVTLFFGHPLVAGMVFAVSACHLLLGLTRRWRPFHALAAMLSLVGLSLTASRGAIAALALGLLTGGLSLLLQRRASVPVKVAAVISFIFVTSVTALSPVMRGRFASREAGGSTLLRELHAERALSVFREDWLLGAGPGLSTQRMSGLLGPGDQSLESGALQAIVSLGALGVAILLALAAALILHFHRRAQPAAVGGLVTLLTAVAGFNVLDNRPTVFVLWSVVVVVGCQSTAPDRTPGTDATPSDGRAREPECGSRSSSVALTAAAPSSSLSVGRGVSHRGGTRST